MPVTTYAIDDAIRSVEENIRIRARQGYSVRSGCGLSIRSGQLGATDTIAIDSGEIVTGGATTDVASQSVGISLGDSLYPRFDTLYLDSTGTLQAEEGPPAPIESDTENPRRRQAVRPAPPPLETTDCVIVGILWVPQGAMEVTSDELYPRAADTRVPYLEADRGQFGTLVAESALDVRGDAQIQDGIGVDLGTDLDYRWVWDDTAQELQLIDQTGSTDRVVTRYPAGGTTDFPNGLQESGSNVLTEADEGSGNGINADQLDGLHRSEFAYQTRTYRVQSDSSTDEYIKIARISDGTSEEEGDVEAHTLGGTPTDNGEARSIDLYTSVGSGAYDAGWTVGGDPTNTDTLSLIVTETAGTGSNGYNEYYLYAHAPGDVDARLQVESSNYIGAFDYTPGLTSSDVIGTIVADTSNAAQGNVATGEVRASDRVTTPRIDDPNSSKAIDLSGGLISLIGGTDYRNSGRVRDGVAFDYGTDRDFGWSWDDTNSVLTLYDKTGTSNSAVIEIAAGDAPNLKSGASVGNEAIVTEPQRTYQTDDYIHIGSSILGPDRESTTSTTYTDVLPTADVAVVPAAPIPSNASGRYITFGCFLENDDSAETTYARVYDRTNATALTGTEVSVTGTTRTLVTSGPVAYNPTGPWEATIELRVSNSSFAGDITSMNPLNIYAQRD